ncbi:hypothetical protein RJ639_030284 [Escallonia herrerae]|uniref:Uncharacterized protein n=1 Tax=Escallonia herrerae TaxID=1293975 RepID=A0AA89BCN3_9ASTE|nr:hypothetical protein RJ639_030284 [Escallonia herrerae]
MGIDAHLTAALSSEAEAGLERLHQCAEKDLQNYLSPDSSSDEFNNFRTKLAGLTRAEIRAQWPINTVCNLYRYKLREIPKRYQCRETSVVKILRTELDREKVYYVGCVYYEMEEKKMKRTRRGEEEEAAAASGRDSGADLWQQIQPSSNLSNQLQLLATCSLSFSQLLLVSRLPHYGDYPDWLKRDVSSEAKTND